MTSKGRFEGLGDGGVSSICTSTMHFSLWVHRSVPVQSVDDWV